MKKEGILEIIKYLLNLNNNEIDGIDEIDKKEKINGINYLDILKIYENQKLNLEYKYDGVEKEELRVYKYIPIDRIEIYLTLHTAEESLEDKVKDAINIKEIIREENEVLEKNKLYFDLFKEKLINLNIQELREVEEEQKEANLRSPEYVILRNNFWEIYCDIKNHRYICIISLYSQKNTESIYLFLKQIENSIGNNIGNNIESSNLDISFDDLSIENDESINDESTQEKNEKNEKIEKVKYLYAPLKYLDLSYEYLDSKELVELENILWYFTKNWPISYERYDIKNQMSLNIVGDIEIYDKIFSKYNLSFKDRKSAKDFLDFVRILFNLQSGSNKKVVFYPRLNKNGKIDFEYLDKKIDKDGMKEFLKEIHTSLYSEMQVFFDQYLKKREEFKNESEYKEELENEYNKEYSKVKEFLDSKKTFLGKIKYFIKSNIKSNFKTIAKRATINLNNKKEDIENLEKMNKNLERFENFDLNYMDKYKVSGIVTIDDFIFLYKGFENLKHNLVNIEDDLEVLILNNKNMQAKIKNTKEYLNEIDSHRKNIFDFWRYATKDYIKAINENVEIENPKKIQSTFDYDIDFNAFSEKVDLKQRELKNEELNSIYLAYTFKKYINMAKINRFEKGATEEFLKILKDMYLKENVSDNSLILSSIDLNTKIVNDKTFRESKRNALVSLKYEKNSTTEYDLIEKIYKIKMDLEHVISKNSQMINMKLYKLTDIYSTYSKDCFDIYNMSIEDEIYKKIEEKIKNNEYVEDKYNLIVLNVKDELNCAYISNSVMYTNNFNTLPLGMDFSKELIIDTSNYQFIKNNVRKVYLKNSSTLYKTIEINILEFDIMKII